MIMKSHKGRVSLLRWIGCLLVVACKGATGGEQGAVLGMDNRSPSGVGGQAASAGMTAGSDRVAVVAAGGTAGLRAAVDTGRASTNAGMQATTSTGSAAMAGAIATIDRMTASAAGASAGRGGGAVAGMSGGGNGAMPESGAFVENAGADCGASPAPMKANPKLPDPFMMHDGTRISSKADWSCRRNEIKQNIEKYEIGAKPAPAMVEASLSGGKLNVKVTTPSGSLTLSSTVTSSAGSDCVAIGMNAPARLITGCVQVPFMHDQVVKYANNSSRSQSDPFYEVYPELWEKVSNYAAWSWGISRLIDGIAQVADELAIDPRRIGVQGCSYAGKMALFAGAFDERIALTIAQESGGGGINSWRTSQDFTVRTGRDIEKIDNTNYAWFLPSMQMLDPYSLPHDHHELIAMIAPRAILALGNQDYEWLGDESGWKSINAAKEVWKALGAEDRIGFDFTSNHTHCTAAASQVASANAFVERFLKGQDANTNIVIEPQEGDFDLDVRSSIDWQTPLLP